MRQSKPLAVVTLLICFASTVPTAFAATPKRRPPTPPAEHHKRERPRHEPPMFITGNNVNIRKAPTRRAKSSGKLNKGMKVFILDSAYEHGETWHKVRTSKGLIGWVHGDYVDSSWTPDGELMEITGDRVNVRSAPSRKANVVARFNIGQEVYSSRRERRPDGIWHYIRTINGVEGWVFGEYIDYP